MASEDAARRAIPAVTIAVVGADYPNKGKGPTRRFEIAICKPGEPIRLVLEPNNPADEHAVAVFSERGVQLGYLPSVRAVRIGQLLRRGHEVYAIFQDQTSFGATIRIAFDGDAPELPDLARVADPDPDFWPDPEWPDE